MTSKRMTPEQVHGVGVAALNNAASHIVSAGILLEYDCARSAYAIGVIGVEELTKFLLCRRRLLRWTIGPTVKELNDELRPRGRLAHLRRYEMALGYMSGFGAPLPSGVSSLREMAGEDMKARERVLYVEVAPSGEPMTPEGVGEGEACSWVSGMRDFFATLVRVPRPCRRARCERPGAPPPRPGSRPCRRAPARASRRSRSRPDGGGARRA